MEHNLLVAFIEATLLTSRGPITETGIAEVAGIPENEDQRVQDAFKLLDERWQGEDCGIRLERVSGGWRCVTRPELDDLLRSFHGLAAQQKLSQAGLEVLSIVAHRQPVTLPEINFIRGANSARVARTLLDRGLIRIAGRKKVVGKPFLYRTTKEFLVHFGLDTLKELPDPEKLINDQVSEAD